MHLIHYLDHLVLQEDPTFFQWDVPPNKNHKYTYFADFPCQYIYIYTYNFLFKILEDTINIHSIWKMTTTEYEKHRPVNVNLGYK